MFKCNRCGKQFATVKALGGHRSYCNFGLLPVKRSGSEVEGKWKRSGREVKRSGSSLQFSSVQLPVLKKAEEVSKKYQLTGKHYGQIQINWGRLLASLAIGGFVSWLVYQALENWDWKGGSTKKQVSPYRLIGGLIQGLG